MVLKTCYMGIGLACAIVGPTLLDLRQQVNLPHNHLICPHCSRWWSWYWIHDQYDDTVAIKLSGISHSSLTLQWDWCTTN